MSGLEIIGIAANIIQIADLGTKLSVQLFTFYRQIQSVNQSVQSLASDVALTSAILHELGKSLEQDEASKLCSKEAHGIMQAVMKQCADVLHQIRDELHDPNTPGKSRWQKATDKLRNVLNESNVNFLKESLEKLKSTMLLLLNVIMCAGQIRNNNVSTMLYEQRELIEKLLEEQRKSNQGQHQRLKVVLPRTGLNGSKINVSTVPINSRSISSDKNELDEYDTLIRKMLHEIDCCKLKLDNARHSRIRGGVLSIHSHEIVQFQRTYGPRIFTHFEDSLFDSSSETTTKLKPTYVSEKQSNNSKQARQNGWESDNIPAYRSKNKQFPITESIEMSEGDNEQQNFGGIEFAAGLAPGAQAAGFDASLIARNPSYETSVFEDPISRQDSAPGEEIHIAQESAKAVASQFTEQKPAAESTISAPIEQSSTTDGLETVITNEESIAESGDPEIQHDNASLAGLRLQLPWTLKFAAYRVQVYGALRAGLRLQPPWTPSSAAYRVPTEEEFKEEEDIIAKVEQDPQDKPARESTTDTVLIPEVLSTGVDPVAAVHNADESTVKKTGHELSTTQLQARHDNKQVFPEGCGHDEQSTPNASEPRPVIAAGLGNAALQGLYEKGNRGKQNIGAAILISPSRASTPDDEQMPASMQGSSEKDYESIMAPLGANDFQSLMLRWTTLEKSELGQMDFLSGFDASNVPSFEVHCTS